MTEKTFTLTATQQSELEIAVVQTAGVLKLLENYLSCNYQDAEHEGLAETAAVVRSRLMQLWSAVSDHGFERRAELQAKGFTDVGLFD